MNRESKGWRELSAAEAAVRWDAMLSNFDDASPFQAFGNGPAAEQEDWTPQYWIRAEGGFISSMALVLVRKLPMRYGMFWIVGGAAGDLSEIDGEFLETLTRHGGFKRGYLRVRADREASPSDAEALRKSGLRPALLGLTSGLTIELELESEPLESMISKNWKRSVRKAEANGLTCSRWEHPDPQVLDAMLAKLEERKGVSVHFPKGKIAGMAAHLGDVFRVYRCDDSMGDIVAFRGSMVFGGRAVDLVAATDEEGLQLGASQFLVLSMAKAFASEGIRHYELGGIDPESNPGVTRFKKESGGRTVRQLGEWDVATSSLLRIAANVAIRLRKLAQSRMSTGTPGVMRISLKRRRNFPDVAVSDRS